MAPPKPVKGSTLGRTATPGGGGKRGPMPKSRAKPAPSPVASKPAIVPGKPNIEGYRSQADLAGKRQSVGSLVGTRRYGMKPTGRK